MSKREYIYEGNGYTIIYNTQKALWKKQEQVRKEQDIDYIMNNYIGECNLMDLFYFLNEMDRACVLSIKRVVEAKYENIHS